MYNKYMDRESIYDKNKNELITLTEAESLGLGLSNTLRVQILRGRRKAIKLGKLTWLIKRKEQ